jgi:5-methylcytosine-specific restriction endonuclease McrA
MPGDPFYQSKPWRELRRQALKRDRYRCVMCGADLRKLGSSRVDHILSRKRRPDLALVLGNLRSLCAPCDNRQAVEKLEHRHGPRFERVDTDGFTAAWHDDPASK